LDKLSKLPSTISLKKLEMDGIFTLKETRKGIRDNFKDSNIELVLLKLNPIDSDDDSAAHDWTDDGSNNSRQETSCDEDEEECDN